MFTASSSWETDIYGSNAVSVFVPLPLEAIRRLNERKQAIEFSKNDYMRAVQNSGRLSFGALHHEVCVVFLEYIIYQDYVPAYKKRVIDACLNHATCFATPQDSLQSIGIFPHDVLVHVAGMQIILLNLQEAVHRSDLFSCIPSLSQVAKHDYTLPPNKTIVSKPSSRLSPNTKIAQAAIVQECIAIPTCKVTSLLGTNQEYLQEMAHASGATMSLLDNDACSTNTTSTRILQVVGNQGAIEKAMELLQERAKTIQQQQQENVVERVLHVNLLQKQSLQGKATLKVICDTSGATDIILQNDNDLLIVRGTKQAVDNAISLLEGWWDAHCPTIKPQDEPDATTIQETALSSTTVPNAVDYAGALSSGNEDALLSQPPSVNKDDDSAWPSLSSSSSQVNSQLPKTPVLGYATKAAMPPKPSNRNDDDDYKTEMTVLQALKSKKPVRSTTVAKVDYNHPCIHGADCQFIQSGRDECKFFHSTQELQQAAAKYTEYTLNLSPAVVGWMIGNEGLRLKELESKSGANMYINQNGSMGTKETRILRITGTAACVSNAIDLVKKLLSLHDDGTAESSIVAPATVAPAVVSVPSTAQQKEASGTTKAATKLAPNKSGSKWVERFVYISPNVIGDVMGKRGAKVMGFEQNSGAKIDIDKERKGNKNENRRVRVSGRQSCVNAAIAMIQGVLPRGYDFESGPGAVSSTAVVPVAKSKGGAAGKKSKKSRTIEHCMYISPAVVGWIIGQDGKRLKERIAKRGAELFIDSDSMRLSENKIVYITARNQKSIDAAIDMIMEQLPAGYTPESGPGLPSSPDSPASSVNSSPKASSSLANHPFDAIVEDPSADIPTSGPETTEQDLALVAFEPSQHEGYQLSVGAVAPPPGFQHWDVHPVSPPRPIRQHVPMQQHPVPVANVSSQAPVSVAGGRVSPTGVPGGNHVASSTIDAMEDPKVLSSESFLDAHPSHIPKVSPPVTNTPTAKSLLSFLKEQEVCYKGSPEAFCEWLSSEDIVTLEDLSEAVDDDEYYYGALQRGNGTVGVKGFRREAFKKAVMTAIVTQTSPTRSLLQEFGR